jgi:branched-chain amino acid transport system permease protein
MTGFYQAHEVLFQTTAIYAVLALSFQVVLRTGVFSFASIGFFGIGAYASADLVMHGVPGILAMIIVIVGCFVLGYALALPFIRLRGLYLGMVTFAFDQIVLVAANNGGSLTGGAVGIYGVPSETTTGELFIIAAIAVVLLSQLERRSMGRSLEAIRTDENLARSLGIEVSKNRNFIFALSAALGGLAGVMDVFNFTSFSTSSFGYSLIVLGLTMAVVGGVDSWLGALIGTVFVVWFPSVVTFVSGTWTTIIYGILVILVVSYEPGGVFGLCRKAIRAVMRRRRGPAAPRVGIADDALDAGTPPAATVRNGPDMGRVAAEAVTAGDTPGIGLSGGKAGAS